MEHKELAEVMGCNTDRVKSLVLGRAKTLRRHEIEALKTSLSASEDWLVDGIGEPPRRPPMPRRTLTRRPGTIFDAVEMERERLGAVVRLMPIGNALGSDAVLLIECVHAAEAALKVRGLDLPAGKRLRLYWAVFELSLAGGALNAGAVAPLIDLAAG